jgi:hypothetical protein
MLRYFHAEPLTWKTIRSVLPVNLHKVPNGVKRWQAMFLSVDITHQKMVTFKSTLSLSSAVRGSKYVTIQSADIENILYVLGLKKYSSNIV